jgi:3-deoxy-manno-octulosonate cytidylyltransferase (CMP-KDO synthetase)
MNPVIFIPTRLGSTRFEGKPLKEVDGIPVIERCYKLASETRIPSFVITPDTAIFDHCLEDYCLRRTTSC